jgi:hypothetical protein
VSFVLDQARQGPGTTGFRLWMSFEEPVTVATAQHFVDLLCAACCPDVILPAQGVQVPVELPPCKSQASGKWAAFINPGMGASFADEPALEMAPPLAAQAAFLHGLQSISHAQLQHALDVLQRVPEQPQATIAPDTDAVTQARAVPYGGGVQHDLLLKDATLEDIVRFLHAQNIEPTFRHLLPPR